MGNGRALERRHKGLIRDDVERLLPVAARIGADARREVLANAVAGDQSLQLGADAGQAGEHIRQFRRNRQSSEIE